MREMSKWAGRTAAVFATGPSLTEQDCLACSEAGFITVGVNSAWKIAPWVDALYCGDFRYWKANIEDIEASGFNGKRYTRSQRAETNYGAKVIRSRLGNEYNSGQMAIEMCIRFGADRVVLLGFDASISEGTHFHGDHTKTPNPTAQRVRRWFGQFEKVNKIYPFANVINCSRKTALDCFHRQSLSSVLKSLS
jgi:hypothetical protein